MPSLSHFRRPVYACNEMPRVHPWKNCRVCDGAISDVGALSARGKCQSCAKVRQGENIAGIKLAEGPYYEHWLRRSFLAYRRRLISLEQPKG